MGDEIGISGPGHSADPEKEISPYPAEFINQAIEEFLNGDQEHVRHMWFDPLSYQRQLLHDFINRFVRKARKKVTREDDYLAEPTILHRKAGIHCLDRIAHIYAVELRHIFLHLTQLHDLLDAPELAGHFIDSTFSLHEVTGCLDADGTNDFLALVLYSKYGDRYREYIPANSEKGYEILKHLRDVDEAPTWLEDVKSALQETPPIVYRCIELCKQMGAMFTDAPVTTQNKLFHSVYEAFKEIKSKRSDVKIVDEDKLGLSRAMLHIVEGLLSRKQVYPNNRFEDLYNYYECIVLQQELRLEEGREKIKDRVAEALRVGEMTLETTWFKGREGRQQGNILSKLGEICRAHKDYECVEDLELSAILEKGIEYFQKDLDILSGNAKPSDLNFTCPRMAECQIELGRFKDAIESLLKVQDPGNGITRETAWEACKRIGDCCQELAKQAHRNDEEESAKKYFDDAEMWYLKAGKIWEPKLNPSNQRFQERPNITLQGILAWHYCERGKYEQTETQAKIFFEKAEKQARLMLSGTESFDPDHKNYYELNRRVLGESLAEQGRYEEATQILEESINSLTIPQHQLKILMVLRWIYAKQNNKIKLQETNPRFFKIAKDTGNDYLKALTDEQESALLVASEMKDYIQKCQERLIRDEARQLLKELPPLIRAARLFNLSHRDDPVLLTLVAKANREMGNYEDSLKTLCYIRNIDPRPRNQGIALLEIGKIYLSQGEFKDAAETFEESFNEGEKTETSPLVLAARARRLAGEYNEALELLKRVINTDDIKKLVKIRIEMIHCLAKMVSLEDKISVIVEMLRKTEDPFFIRCLAAALGRQHKFPQAILDVVLSRIGKLEDNIELMQAFIKILSRALVSAYYSGTAGNISFKNLATEITSIFLELKSDIRRRYFFELLVAERDAPLTELITLYSGEAMNIFAPIMSDISSANEELKNPEFLKSINDFLRNKFPESILPQAYGSGDGAELYPLIEELVNDVRFELREEIEYGNQILLSESSNETFHIPVVSWIRAKPFIEDLIDVAEGSSPFAIISSETSPWEVKISAKESSIEMFFSFAEIEPTHQPEEILNKVRKALESYCNQNQAKEYIELLDLQRWESERRARIIINFPIAHRLPQDFTVLEGFIEYLESESLRFMNGGEFNDNFYRESHQLFAKYDDTVFQSCPEKWVTFLQQLLDLNYATLIKWLFFPSVTVHHHPRTAVHSLKNNLKVAINNQKRGIELSPDDFKNLRKGVLRLNKDIATAIRTEVFGSSPVFSNLSKIIEQVKDEILAEHSDVRLKIICSPDINIPILPMFLERVFLNLLHNSLQAVSSPNVLKKEISLVVSENEATDKVLIRISNPYDPDAQPSESSTGIGLDEVRYIVKNLYGGVFEVDPNKEQRIYETRVSLVT